MSIIALNTVIYAVPTVLAALAGTWQLAVRHERHAAQAEAAATGDEAPPRPRRYVGKHRDPESRRAQWGAFWPRPKVTAPARVAQAAPARLTPSLSLLWSSAT